MKKLTAILLAFALLLSFAGCISQEDVDKAVNDASAPLKEQIATLKNEKAALAAEKAALEADIDEIDAEITTLNAKVAELETNGEADDAEIARLKGDISTLEGKKTELSGKVTELENNISAKDTEIADLNSSIATLTEEKQTLNDKIAELEKENEGLKNCLAGEHAYSYTDNHEKTHKGTCIWCDDTTIEAHSFADGACSVCGIAGGYCGAEGENAVWTFKNGAFTLSGIGEVHAYGISAFPWKPHYRQFENIVIKDGITNIPEWAFYNSTVKTVTLPGSVTAIGEHAFYFCNNMESITLSEGLQSIGAHAFSSCYALKSITIPASVTSIGFDALDSSLEEILVAEGNPAYRSIDGNLYAFDGHMLTLIRYADNSSKNSFVTPAGVMVIDREACADTGYLVSVTLSEDVYEVRDSAFFGCYRLTKLTILSRRIYINAHAFELCDNLRDIYYAGTQEEWERIGAELPEGVTVHYNYIA